MPRALIVVSCLVLSAALAACGADSPEESAEHAVEDSDSAKDHAETGAGSGSPAAPSPEAGAPGASPQAAPEPPATARAEETCPVGVPATSVTVVNTKGGVALYFTTTGSNVGEVRRRVGALATASTVAPDAPPPDRDARRGTDVPFWDNAVRPELVPLRATAEEISEGARLILIPLDPVDLELLRAYARSHGDRMRLGSCAPDFLKQRANASAGTATAGAGA